MLDMPMPPLHTDKEYEAELTQLRELLLLMGAHVEQQLTAAIGSIATGDATAARAVIAADEEIDKIELRADQACVQLLATRQPVARDLRFIMTALKVVTDLERMGDLAGKVAKLVIAGIATTDAEALRLTGDMGRAVVAMLHDAIDALVEADVFKAEAVIQRDDWIDEQCAALLGHIAAAIGEQPARTDAYLRLHTVARSIERIGDHSTNLAEMVVFLVRGRDVRHLRRSSWIESGDDKVH